MQGLYTVFLTINRGQISALSKKTELNVGIRDMTRTSMIQKDKI